LAKLLRQFCFVLEFAFPNYYRGPTQTPQRDHIPLVALSVAGQLGAPELRPGLRQNRVSTVAVTVPETAMDKYHGCKARENDVRAARQVLPPQREPIAHAVKERPYPP